MVAEQAYQVVLRDVFQMVDLWANGRAGGHGNVPVQACLVDHAVVRQAYQVVLQHVFQMADLWVHKYGLVQAYQVALRQMVDLYYPWTDQMEDHEDLGMVL